MNLQPLSEAPLKDRVYAYIKEFEHVTFYEIEERFGAGNFMTTTTGLEKLNIVLWVGLSKEAAGAIRELRNEELIAYTPSNIITYAITGPVLNIPHVKTDRTKRYKKQHWLPVFIVPTALAMERQ